MSKGRRNKGVQGGNSPLGPTPLNLAGTESKLSHSNDIELLLAPTDFQTFLRPYILALD